MKISQLEKYLFEIYKSYHHEQLPPSTVLLIGPPGIGKSVATKELAIHIARVLQKEFIDYNDNFAPMLLANPDKYFVYVDFRLTEVEPSDLLGIPERVNGAVRFAPLLWAEVLEKCEGVLMLDELLNVQRDDVIAVSYKILNDRKVGFVPLNDKVFIVTAGNDPEQSSVARHIPTPMMNRVLRIDVDEPKIISWIQWMDSHHPEKWDKRTAAFLLRFESEDYLLQVPHVSETLNPYPTPRSWERTSVLMHMGFADTETLQGFLGGEVAEKLQVFMKLTLNIEDIIANPESFAALSTDGQYMALLEFASWLDKHTTATDKYIPLFDVISKLTKEYLVITCILIKTKDHLVKVLTSLITHNAEYRTTLMEVAELKNLIDNTVNK